MTIGGMKIIYTAAATTQERNFPESKHRSKRIFKKLCKRFGGEYRYKPCAYACGDTLFIHPALKEELERACQNLNLNSPAMSVAPTKPQPDIEKEERMWFTGWRRQSNYQSQSIIAASHLTVLARDVT